MDVVRLNFSHGTWPEHQARLDRVRELNRKLGRKVMVMLDLEGPRIRLGRLKSGTPLLLRKPQQLWLTTEPLLGDKNVLSLDYPGSLRHIKKNQPVFIDDGSIELRVLRVEKTRVKVEVVIGGLLKEHKGVNIPGASLDFDPVTEKDQKDILFAVRNQVDLLALSFVRDRSDMALLKKFIGGRLPHTRLVAKIENAEAVINFQGILRECHGVMVARGDMGVSLPIWQVPVLQKMLIKECGRHKKFSITATQMLESMAEHSRPTRAEVSDVANAVLDGTDYVMLSAETAVGRYPVETVAMMDRILRFTERTTPELNRFKTRRHLWSESVSTFIR